MTAPGTEQASAMAEETASGSASSPKSHRSPGGRERSSTPTSSRARSARVQERAANGRSGLGPSIATAHAKFVRTSATHSQRRGEMMR